MHTASSILADQIDDNGSRIRQVCDRTCDWQLRNNLVVIQVLFKPVIRRQLKSVNARSQSENYWPIHTAARHEFRRVGQCEYWL